MYTKLYMHDQQGNLRLVRAKSDSVNDILLDLKDQQALNKQVRVDTKIKAALPILAVIK